MNISPPFPLQQSVILSKPKDNIHSGRKLLSIHSCDRDISQFPDGNNFEVILPQSLKNVLTMRLVEGNFPTIAYNFSSKLQNTRLVIEVSGNPFTAQLSDGYYTPSQLAFALQTTLNTAVASIPPYTNFVCSYNEVEFKMYIGNKDHAFSLKCDVNPGYDLSCCPPMLWDNTCNWGFPYSLGYEKEKYTAIKINDKSQQFNYSTTPWLVPTGSNGHYVTSPTLINFLGVESIYMEVDRYNNIDETSVNQKRNNNAYGSDRHNKVNSSFAKIPIFNIPYGQVFDSRSGFYQNLYTFNCPEERIERLRFKFRRHNNTLVDFKNIPFSFTLEFVYVTDEICDLGNIKMPPIYTM
jgi:hypothetical protein